MRRDNSDGACASHMYARISRVLTGAATNCAVERRARPSRVSRDAPRARPRNARNRRQSRFSVFCLFFSFFFVFLFFPPVLEVVGWARVARARCATARLGIGFSFQKLGCSLSPSGSLHLVSAGVSAGGAARALISAANGAKCPAARGAHAGLTIRLYCAGNFVGLKGGVLF